MSEHQIHPYSEGNMIGTRIDITDKSFVVLTSKRPTDTGTESFGWKIWSCGDKKGKSGRGGGPHAAAAGFSAGRHLYTLLLNENENISDVAKFIPHDIYVAMVKFADNPSEEKVIEDFTDGISNGLNHARRVA